MSKDTMDGSLQHPIYIQELSTDKKLFLKKRHLQVLCQWVYVRPSCQLLQPTYIKLWKKFYEFEYREKDMVILGYPKTGTTWMAEILWAMTSVNNLHLAEEEGLLARIYNINNDMVRASKEGDDTAVMRKFRSTFPGEKIRDDVTLSLAKIAPDRRVLKTQLLPSLLHPNMLNTCKVVYLIRNPKDACASFYNMDKDYKESPFLGDFTDYFEMYTSDTPMFGTFWNHINEIWQLKGHPNLLIVFYEDLKLDLMGELERLNSFFDLHLTKEELTRVMDHCSLKNMKQREAKVPVAPEINTFIREGKIGGWKNVATPELDLRMDKWIKENSKGLDIVFKYQ